MSTAAATVFRGCRALTSSAAAAKGVKKSASAAAKPKAAKKLVDPNNLRGIMRPVPVSDALRKFGGATHISRSGVLKIVWDYIRPTTSRYHTINHTGKKANFCLFMPLFDRLGGMLDAAAWEMQTKNRAASLESATAHLSVEIPQVPNVKTNMTSPRSAMAEMAPEGSQFDAKNYDSEM